SAHLHPSPTRRSSDLRVAFRSDRFAVHFLTTADRELAHHFGARSGSETDKFAGLAITVTEAGVPLIADLPNRIIVERIAMLDDRSEEHTSELQSRFDL